MNNRSGLPREPAPLEVGHMYYLEILALTLTRRAVADAADADADATPEDAALRDECLMR